MKIKGSDITCDVVIDIADIKEELKICQSKDMEKEVRYATYKSYVRVFMHDLMTLEGVIAREKKPPAIIGRWFFCFM